MYFPQDNIPAYLSPLERRFWTFFPLGLLSLPTQWMPPGPVTLWDSRPFDDFLKVNSTASPSLRLRKPSMWSLLWIGEEGKDSDSKCWGIQVCGDYMTICGEIYCIIDCDMNSQLMVTWLKNSNMLYHQQWACEDFDPWQQPHPILTVW